MENYKGTIVNNNYCCCCCDRKGDTGTGVVTAQVGSIMYAHILQPGYVKANGDLLNRSEYADLYEYAKKNGLVLSEDDWANDMQGMFAEGDGVNTFRVPDLRGQFLRGMDDTRGIDIDRALGSQQGDAIRNMTGSYYQAYENSKGETAGVGGHKGDGVFVPDISVSSRPYVAPAEKYNPVPSAMGVTFDASRVVPTAEENRPKNIALIAQIKY